MSERVKKLLFVSALLLSLALPPLRRCLWALLLSLLLGWVLRRGAAALERRGLPRRAAAAAVAAGGAALVSLTLWGTLGAVWNALNRAACLLPDTDRLFPGLRRLAAALPDGLGALAAQGADLLEQRSNLLREQLLLRTAQLSGRFLAQVPQWLFFFFIVGLSAFYAAADWPRLRPALLALVPRDWRGPLGGGLNLLRQGLRRWLRVQGRLLLLQFLLLTAGLLLLGQRAAGGLAALTALADALPLLGTGAVLLPLALLRLLEGERLTALGLVALAVCCWTVRTVLEPRLVGRQAGLNPFFTLLALYLGAQCFGVAGMIGALVAASALPGLRRTASADKRPAGLSQNDREP